MCFLPKQPFIAFSLYQLLPNGFNAEPSTADLPPLTKGSPLCFPWIFCTDLQLAEKLQHSQMTTALWLSWVWVSLVVDRRQRMRRVNQVPLQPVQQNQETSLTPAMKYKPQTPAVNQTCNMLQFPSAEPVCSPQCGFMRPNHMHIPSSPSFPWCSSTAQAQVPQMVAQHESSHRFATLYMPQYIPHYLHSTWAAMLFRLFCEQKTYKQLLLYLLLWTCNLHVGNKQMNLQDPSLSTCNTDS